MKLNFLSRTLPAFGLNLSSNSLKVLQLQKNSGQILVKGFHSSPLPKGLLVNESITDPKNFSFLLRGMLEHTAFGNIETNYVVASLPESKSFVRVIQIPQMSLAEAENAIPFEAENFIPLPVDQVYLDWQQIGSSSDPARPDGGGDRKMSVLIIASPKDYVEKFLDILDKSGLVPVALEVESQSVLRALQPSINADNAVLIKIGSKRTGLIVVEGGNLQFTSSIPMGGEAFTESIAKALGISSVKAEEIKKKFGFANTVEYPNLIVSLAPVLNSLADEIKNILKFHSEHSDKKITRAIIVGGGAKMTNLSEALVPNLQETGITAVELGNPWLNRPQTKSPALNALDSLSFIPAIGLALRGVEHEP